MPIATHDFTRVDAVLHDVWLTAIDRIKATTRDPEVLGIIREAEEEHDRIEGRESLALMPADDSLRLEHVR